MLWQAEVVAQSRCPDLTAMDRDQNGPLLHVPITKYKIIPNPNPNPNTKMTVNTIPKQM